VLDQGTIAAAGFWLTPVKVQELATLNDSGLPCIFKRCRLQYVVFCVLRLLRVEHVDTIP
jgi:hypothetical protein